VTTRDIEEIIPASVALRTRREEWEREQLDALAERRARKLPITEEEIERDLERRLMASAPLVNARAAEVRARQERIKTHKPRSIAPPPVAPRVVEPPAPPRKVATKKPARAPAPKASAALGDGPAAVIRRAPSAPPPPRPVTSPRVEPAPAPVEAVEASTIPTEIQQAIRHLHRDGVPVKILAKIYGHRQADVRALLQRETS
jgi:hypothetical protein